MAPLSSKPSPRARLLLTASRVEQEIRAHPRLYAMFYATITRHDGLRDLAGRVKDGVRLSSSPAGQVADVSDCPGVVVRREGGIAVRLGIDEDVSS